MKAPAQSTIHRAMVKWTKAWLRFNEFALADVGSPRYLRLLPEAGERRDELMRCQVKLLSIGTKLLLSTAKGQRKK